MLVSRCKFFPSLYVDIDCLINYINIKFFPCFASLRLKSLRNILLNEGASNLTYILFLILLFIGFARSESFHII